MEIPPLLAVANIHRDYLSVCVEHCCTGGRYAWRAPEGAITFVRQTAGGAGKGQYGVVGVWYYTGRSEPVPRREALWPAKWDTKLLFRPLVRRFTETWCEDFSVPVQNGWSGATTSRYVEGLAYTKLQGVVVSIKDHDLARRYIKALLKARASELDLEADYLGQQVRVARLLERLCSLLG